MLSARVRSTKTRNVGQKVRNGVRRGMLDAADAGFAVAFDEAPSGATGGLKHSAVQPEWVGDTLVWGFTAPYARYVEEGTSPHHPPIEPLKLWASRVLGDEDAAWAVQQKIGSEGTEGQEFVLEGFEVMVRELRSRGLSNSISTELR